MVTYGQRRQNLIYDNSEFIEIVNQTQVGRKKAFYWLGFLEGALSSGRIEHGEPVAVAKEAEEFARFFDDPDARDFVADFNARCFSSAHDVFDCLTDMHSEKLSQVTADGSISYTDEVNQFLGFCAGIICDGKVLPEEALAIKDRLLHSEVLQNEPAVKDLRNCVLRTLADGLLSANELVEIQEFLARLVGDGYCDTGMANIGQVSTLEGLIVDPESVVFRGRTFVITGPMRMGTRSHVVRLIEKVGGSFATTPSKAVDYVVVAVNASTMWKTTHYGTKIERARMLISKGSSLNFLCESALEAALETALSSS
jgi:NAD-dependent DNA ligase